MKQALNKGTQEGRKTRQTTDAEPGRSPFGRIKEERPSLWGKGEDARTEEMRIIIDLDGTQKTLVMQPHMEREELDILPGSIRTQGGFMRKIYTTRYKIRKEKIKRAQEVLTGCDVFELKSDAEFIIRETARNPEYLLMNILLAPLYFYGAGRFGRFRPTKAYATEIKMHEVQMRLIMQIYEKDKGRNGKELVALLVDEYQAQKKRFLETAEEFEADRSTKLMRDVITIFDRMLDVHAAVILLHYGAKYEIEEA